MPVPPHGSKAAKSAGALAFNQALNADSHRVYVSDAATADGGFEMELTAPSNIVALPTAYSTPGTQYYWRVDPVFSGTQKLGQVWQYQVAEEVDDPAPVSTQCVNVSGAVGPTASGWREFQLEDVPVNAGLGKRFVLKSTKICVNVTGAFTPNFQFRIKGRKQKLLGAFWGHKPNTLDGVQDIQGCFVDGGVTYEPTALAPDTMWRPKKGGWEVLNNISDYMAEEDLSSRPVSFRLRIKGTDGAGELKAWGMEFCFDRTPDEDLPAAGTGACVDYSYA